MAQALKAVFMGGFFHGKKSTALSGSNGTNVGGEQEATGGPLYFGSVEEGKLSGMFKPRKTDQRLQKLSVDVIQISGEGWHNDSEL